MSEETYLGLEALTPSQVRLVEDACDRFEAAWKAAASTGQRPRIEDHLAKTQGPGHAVLLQELIALDVAYRQRAGETPRVEEYQARFSSPDLSELIDPTRPRSAAPPPDRRSPGPPPTIPGFEITGELGRGGMGIVYRAWQGELRRTVAIKILLAGAHASEPDRARFRTEAEAVARLQHPHILQIYEVSQLADQPYMVLEYMDGGSLARKLNGTPLAAREAAQWVATLAGAVHYFHQRGIVHRDLTPANVLLARADQPHGLPLAVAGREGRSEHFIPKITDFGLVKLLADVGPTLTQSGALLGTPSYMAPEQAAGRSRDVGPPADVYALGAILYEMLTGRPPFKAETVLETLLQVKTQDTVPPSRLRPRLPRDLSTICMKCLHKEPRKRYASAEALGDDLRRFLAGRPIQARPVSRTEQALKWARRRPALAATLAALALVTALGMGGILGQWLMTQEALAREATARRRAEGLHLQAQQARQAEADARERSEVALYHHRVVLAHHEWLAGNVGRASQLLNDCRADLRGWEYGYVRRLCEHDLVTLRGHVAPVTGVAFSPDGRRLASSAGQWFTNDPGEVKLWDAATGRVLWTGQGHTGPVMGVAFSPDGSRLASAAAAWDTGGGEIKVWETATGRVLRTLAGFPKGAFSVAYSPDGKLLASGGKDAKVRLWDPATGEQRSVLDNHKTNVFGVAFHPDGSRLASASWDGTACVWEVAGPRLIHVLHGPEDLRSVQFSPDGKQLVTASYDHGVKVWDTASGQLVRTYWGHPAAVLCATFAPDGSWVASSDSSGHVHLWNARTGRLVRTIHGHTGSVPCVAFGPEGRRLATVGADRTIRIWDCTRDQEALSLDSVEPARNVVFSPDSKYLAAAGYRHSSGSPLVKTVRVWSGEDFARPQSWAGHTDWVTCVAFSPTGNVLASGSNDRTVRLWDVATGQTLHEIAGHQKMVTGVAFSPDGLRLASASLDQVVRLWDVASGQLLAPVLAQPQPVRDVAFSHDGRRLVVVGEGGMVQVWDAETGKKVCALPGHQEVVERAVFSPDGGLLATAAWDKTIRLWDVTTDPPAGQAPAPVRILVGPSEADRITGLAFSADGRRLASGGRDHTIRIWDVASGDETLTLRGDLDLVYGLSFSPDGRWLASASTRDIKLWDAGAAK